MKILFIFGTRPEAIKMAPIIIKMKDKVDSFEVSICVTGQHREMLAQVLNFFSLVPDYNLDIMKKNQSLFDITANSLSLLEGVIDDSKPDLIMVQGDTTSALVGGLAGYYKKIRVAHIEAGLRSGDKFTPFPEEMNRILVARLADYHFAPTDRAKNALIYEGVSSDNIFVVGNSVIDALLLSAQLINKDNKKYIKEFSGIDFTKKIILVTGHRRENFGKGFEDICIALEEISSTHDKSVEIVYPVHLNPNVRDVVFERLNGRSNIHLIEPLSYPSLIWLMNKSYLVLTDSGGIQEEAPSLGKPVLVMREVTERMEGVNAGTAKLVGTDKDIIIKNVNELINNSSLYKKMSKANNPYGEGNTASMVIEALENIE